MLFGSNTFIKREGSFKLEKWAADVGPLARTWLELLFWVIAVFQHFRKLFIYFRCLCPLQYKIDIKHFDGNFTGVSNVIHDGSVLVKVQNSQFLIIKPPELCRTQHFVAFCLSFLRKKKDLSNTHWRTRQSYNKYSL